MHLERLWGGNLNFQFFYLFFVRCSDFFVKESFCGKNESIFEIVYPMERSNAHIASFVVSELQILRDLALCVYAEDQLPGMFANEKAYEEAEETLFRDLVTGSDFVSRSGAFSNSIRRTKIQVQLFFWRGTPQTKNLFISRNASRSII